MTRSQHLAIPLFLALALALTACAPSEDAATTSAAAPDAPTYAERLAKFAETELRADLSGIPEDERAVLGPILDASRIMDEIFLRQVWEENPSFRETLPDDPELRALYAVHFGPWDRVDEMKAFVGDVAHPTGAGYYPQDLTKEEFEAWIAAHPDDKAAFESLHTLIRRDGDGLVAVPYSKAFAEWLEPAATSLREAADRTSNASLATFLRSRADAFGTDDYFQSDLDWMDLDAPVEVTIGPYEVYEDKLFAYKAAFEAFVTIALPEESAKVDRYKALLPSLERSLPIPDEHKNLDRGTESPIRVVDVLYVGGDSKAGVQTLAFNLPNDERVREAKGSKKVILRNVLRAKFDKILLPIAERTVAEDQIGDVAFQAFFNSTLHHELSHGLGPGNITVDGRETEVRLELKELYSTLEEAKADVMGIYNILQLIDSGEMDADLRKILEPTYVAGLFRSARFGLHEAHGRGVVAQFTYLLEKGALEVGEDGRFRAVSEKFPGAIESLLSEMLMLQANGDYEGTETFLDTYGRATPELEAAIGRLGDVPVDIRPVYSQADEISGL